MLQSDEIKQILPHRYPFLLVDRIDEMGEDTIVGRKCVSSNEMQFLGHFPQKQVMPGVLIVEALAQTGAVLLLSKAENKGKLAFFAGINAFSSCRCAWGCSHFKSALHETKTWFVFCGCRSLGRRQTCRTWHDPLCFGG